MEHKLLFINPSYHKGVNTTIRLGDKWCSQSKVGDTIVLEKTGEEVELARGVITKLEYKDFMDITIGEFDNLACKVQYYGVDSLITAMLRAYPSFNLSSMVTVITFKI